ncbi:MAG: peptidase [Anaerolineales bacterium]|nr:MAG: peptidase [Anaerolineales bacterium]
MKKNTIYLFQVKGIPIGLDPSWFLVFALVTWILAVNYFPSEFKQWSLVQFWLVAAVTAILFFVSVFLHELGHSLVALGYKLPVKSITLYIFGGISEITSSPASPLQEFVVAVAGPLTSLLLAAFFYVIQVLFQGIAPVYASAKYLAYINALLGVFNLIPGFPLDGGRVFRAIVWAVTRNLRRATEIAGYLGQAIAFIFILLGVWLLFRGDWINGLWIAFIGWFLESAVVGQVQQERMHDLLAGHTVDQIMSRSCVMSPAEITLQELVNSYFLGQGQRCVVVMRLEQPVGFLTLHNIRELPREQWASTQAWQVMTPMDKVKVTGPKVELVKVLEEMGTDGVNQMPVMQDGQVEGMLTREDIVNYMKTLQKLEK